MKFLIIFGVILILHMVKTSAMRKHCLATIDVTETYSTKHAISDSCVTDDISRLHIYQDVESIQPNKTTIYKTTIQRKYFQKDWMQCRPALHEQGPLSIIRINPDASIHVEQHACSTKCNVHIDKTEGTIVLESGTINFYEIDGKTTVRGWFKFKQTVELSSTCEQLTVKCGPDIQIMKVCFNENFSCIKLFRQYWLPEKFGHAFCQNLELIILMSIIILSFIIVKILLKTYLAFVLFPFYYPLCYLLSLFQDKVCATCKICGQTYHPFTKCSLTCTCGATFMSTQELWKHRKTLSCPGPKISVKAIKMCKSQSINFTLVIMLCILLSSLISPVRAYTLEELQPWRKDSRNQETILTINSILGVCILAFCSLGILAYAVIKSIVTKSYPKCKMCMCYHQRDLSCNWCICGKSTIVSDAEIKLDSKSFSLGHVADSRCIASHINQKYKNISMVNVVLIGIIGILISLSPVYANPYASCTSGNKTPKQTYPYYLRTCVTPDIQVTNDDLLLLVNTAKFESDKFCEIESKLAKLACDSKTRRDFQGSIKLLVDSVKNIILNTTICKELNLSVCSTLSNNQKLHRCKRILLKDHASLKENIKFAMELMLSGFGGEIKFHPSLKGKESEVIFREFFQTLPYNNEYKEFAVLKKFAVQLRQIELLLKMYTSKDITYLTATGGYVSTNIDTKNIHDTCTGEEPTPEPPTTPAPTPTSRIEPKDMGPIISGPESLIPRKDKEDNSTIMAKSGEDLEVDYDEIPIEVLGGQDGEFAAKSDTERIILRKIKKCTITDAFRCKKKKNKGISENLVVCNGHGLFVKPPDYFPCNGVDIGCYCYAKNCLVDSTELDPTEYVECQSIGKAGIILTPKTLLHNNMADYTKQIQSETVDDLIVHAFKKTAYTPKIKPTYNPVTIQGQETAEGMMNSYITGIIPAIEGKSTGFKVYAPGTKKELLDIIITVSKARTKSTYRYLYSTGPTKTINVKYAEKCTGRCPKDIPREGVGYLTFSKESTSQWGCEEYGCLAIGEGCVYGSCMDVIENEYEIYKKKYETKKEVEICFAMSQESYCKEITIDEAIETEKIELSFQTQEIDELPELIAVRKGRIYTGDIADLGAFGSGCGSIQKIRHLTFGTGTPDWSYFCHAADNKDIVVRKCAINNYQACQHLTRRDDLMNVKFTLESRTTQENHPVSGLLDAKDITRFYNESYYWGNLDVQKSMHSIGFINFKLMLGDISYKTYTEKLSFEITGSCAGCVDCADDISCDVHIVSEYETSCPIHAADCIPYINRILIQPGITQHGIKVKCNTNNTNIRFTICGQAFGPKVTIVQPSVVDIDSDGQTAYIVQKNNECNTWLCKVMKEGKFTIGSLWNPFSGLSSFFSWIGMILMGVMIGMFIYFVGIPIAKKVIESMKKKELEYQKINSKTE
nr:putative glycoprotein [Asum virus]